MRESLACGNLSSVIANETIHMFCMDFAWFSFFNSVEYLYNISIFYNLTSHRNYPTSSATV